MTILDGKAVSSSTPGHRAPPATGTYAGSAGIVRFLLRRNRLRLMIWTVVLVGMVALVYQSQQAAFPTQADRDAYARIANTPAVAALTGLPYAAGSLGGILTIKIWMTLAVALGFASIFLMTRNGRAEEEAGRTDLLRAGVVGRHANTMAAQLVVGGLSVVIGFLIAIECAALGLPVDGSLVMGASIAGVGIAVLGVAAVAGQLASTGRGATTLAAVVFAVFYLIRAIADVDAEGTSASALSWASPLGWAQNMRAFGENVWWPLVPLLALGVGGCLLAIWIEGRRDLGSGILPNRPAPIGGSRTLVTSLGLAARLQRGAMIGWLCGAVVGGAFFGGVAAAMANALDGSSQNARAFAGSGGSILDGIVGTLIMMQAMIAAAFAVQSATSVRRDEQAARLEPLLAGPVSRVRWSLTRYLLASVWGTVILVVGGGGFGVSFALTQGDPGAVGRLTVASLAYLPSLLVFVGIVVLVTGWLPRQAIALGWAAYGVSVVVALFGPLFSLSDGVIRATPFAATPRVPAAAFDAGPLVALVAVAALCWALGLFRFRARDLDPD